MLNGKWCLLTLGVMMAGCSIAPPVDEAGRPLIKKLGTIDCDLVETTPVVFRGRLYRFEYVHDNYKQNRTGSTYFRFVDVESGRATAGFAAGYALGSAYIEDDMVYVYGVKGSGAPEITAFWSKDLENWSSQPALTLPGWGLYNNSVCQGPNQYVMAFEVGEPRDVVGTRFTTFFAASKDLLNWKPLPVEYVYTKERYSACPTIRFLDDYYYMIYLEQIPGEFEFVSHIVRSSDLKNWESSPLNLVLSFSKEDKRIANSKLTTEQRQRIAKAVNINNSDVDFCEYKGRVIINYSWGCQKGVEHLAEAVYEGTLEQFFEGWFPTE